MEDSGYLKGLKEYFLAHEKDETFIDRLEWSLINVADRMPIAAQGFSKGFMKGLDFIPYMFDGCFDPASRGNTTLAAKSDHHVVSNKHGLEEDFIYRPSMLCGTLAGFYANAATGLIPTVALGSLDAINYLEKKGIEYIESGLGPRKIASRLASGAKGKIRRISEIDRGQLVAQSFIAGSGLYFFFSHLGMTPEVMSESPVPLITYGNFFSYAMLFGAAYGLSRLHEFSKPMPSYCFQSASESLEDYRSGLSRLFDLAAEEAGRRKAMLCERIGELPVVGKRLKRE